MIIPALSPRSTFSSAQPADGKFATYSRGGARKYRLDWNQELLLCPKPVGAHRLSCVSLWTSEIYLRARNLDTACPRVISLASLGRLNATRGSKTQYLESAARNDNALAAISPVMAGINHAPVSMSASDGVQGRKRNVTIAGMDSSPGSIEDVDDNDAREERRRQPVKRACNECRQQKVREQCSVLCDNVANPATGTIAFY